MLVPPRLAQKIWVGEYVDMSELLPERMGHGDDTSGRAGETKRKRRKVSSALQWVECFHTYIGVVAQRQPERVADLLAYANLIVHASRKFKGEGWLQYDRNFRKSAEVHPGIRWAEANTSLWTLAFCNAQPRPHCELCFSIDHETEQCDEYSPPEEPAKRRPAPSSENYPRPQGKTPICVNWNRRSCTSSTCSFQHICLECHQRHKEKDCSVAVGKQPPPGGKGKQRGYERKPDDWQPFRRRGPNPR